MHAKAVIGTAVTALALATTPMTHIAIQEALDGEAVEWLEHVSDEQSTSTRSH